MNKRFFTLAIAAVLCMPVAANADTVNVNVYGTINADFEGAQGTGAINGNNSYSRFRVTSNSSNFGIKGNEDLGDGLKLVFQLENSINVATGGATSFPTSTVSGTTVTHNPTGFNIGIAQRNSKIGLEGGFGSIAIGKWDTPFKVAQNFMEPFYATGVGYLANILDSRGNGATSVDALSEGYSTGDRDTFNRRQGHSLMYTTPTFSGLAVNLVYSADVDRNVSNGGLIPDLWGGGVTYSNGPINAALAFEEHDDFTSATQAQKDMGIKAAFGYLLPTNTSLGVAVSHISWDTQFTAGDQTYTRDAFAISVMHPLGSLTIRAAYAMALDGSTTLTSASNLYSNINGLGANQITLGASYSFSKRSDMYLVFSKITNTNGYYNFLQCPVSGGTTASIAGISPTALGLGLRHTF